jgi:lysophospholipase L1-like esterase
MSLPQLFVIGDSISMQYGPHLEKLVADRYTYTRRTGQEPPFANGAVSPNGGDSSRVLEYLKAMCAWDGFQPQVLLLNCGLHDIKVTPETGVMQVSLEQYRDNLSQIIALLKGRPLKLVWVRTTPVDDERHNTHSKSFHRHQKNVLAYNAVADDLMRAAGARLLDLFSFSQALGPNAFCDHVHYTDPVRAQQAAYIAGFLDALAQ